MHVRIDLSIMVSVVVTRFGPSQGIRRLLKYTSIVIFHLLHVVWYLKRRAYTHLCQTATKG